MTDLEKIIKAFDGKLVGSKSIQKLVAQTVLIFPQDTQDFLTQKVWFMSSDPDSWAFTFRGSDLVDNYLIFLSDDLLHQSVTQIQFTIAHEVGHIMLKHRNAVFDYQSKDEIAIQEKEADLFAQSYFPIP